MRKVTSFSFVIGIFILSVTSVNALQIHPVTKDGRQIQLDGFLLEWKKTDAIALDKDSLWSWDAINTREGLTGYFNQEKLSGCKGWWTFRFLPCKLSAYKSMEIHTNAASGQQSFYRLSNLSAVGGQLAACEWIIPWKDICHDSAGAYQVGLFAFNSCGDTLQPIILTGHLFKPKAHAWGGVYGKMILLGALLALLFILQKSSRGKIRNRK